MGRGMTQPGGLGGSGDEGPKRGEQRLEASLALERKREVSGSGGQWEGKETVGSDVGTGISDLTSCWNHLTILSPWVRGDAWALDLP